MQPMEAFFSTACLTATALRDARDEPDTHSAAESDLQLWHDAADAGHLEIRENDEVLVRPEALTEPRAHAATDRQSPGRLVEGVEQKARECVHASGVRVDVVDARPATGAIDPEPDVVSEREVHAGAALERTALDRSYIDGIGAKFDRRRGRRG